MKETIFRNQEQKFKVFAGVVLIVFGLLTVKLWILQIMQGASIMVESRRNQTRINRIAAPRGNFYDRNNTIVVNSRISRNVSVVPDDIKNKPDVLKHLSQIVNIPVSELKNRLKPDPKHPIAPYQYVPIAKDISTDTMIRISEAKLDLPGVDVDNVSLRSYPNGEFASHALGYIREINEQELNQLKDKGYRPGDIIGKTGLEKTYEEYLRGQDGGKIFEVDIQGRVLRLLDNKEPIPGDNIYLTLDANVQKAADKALDDQFAFLQKYSKYQNARSGAVIALDPRNGHILAMSSKPGFDPNMFVGVITPELAKQVFNNPLTPTLNRVTQGEYAPGSTFKPVTVTSALMEKKVTTKDKFLCEGWDPVWGRLFKCWIATSKSGPRGHGWQTVVDGLKNSCNIVMADLARSLGPKGPDILAKYSRMFGLGKPTGINLYPEERTGFVPDLAWRHTKKDKTWYPIETLHYAIGQGALTVTPLQLAQMYAAIANGGKVYRPQLVTKITTPTGQLVKKFKPELVNDIQIPAEDLDAVHEGLREVIKEGTASAAFWGFPLNKYPIAGKTGTAQRTGYTDTGVFACYAPADNPQIVVIVLIEQGGSGSGGAAPVARKILEAYFNLNKPAAKTASVKNQSSSAVSPGTSGTSAASGQSTNEQPSNQSIPTPSIEPKASPAVLPGQTTTNKPENNAQ